ncbi:MAG: thioredoxin family protein [Zoogloeaceae bacterium]|jgi:thiol:disulfide interchange protein DsbD|nr:thioredoxin family protein [Zoogloeaceae bacterium]
MVFLRFRISFFFVLFAVLCPVFAGAALPPERAATPRVAATLVAGADAARPGGEIRLGVRQEIIPRWHTYWKNPGDSGIATRIDWQLPAGSEVGAIEWPIPARFVLGPVTSYGYAQEVTLLATARVPENAAPGSVFSIRAKVDWLVCEEECIPEQVELGLQLPVVAPNVTPGAGHPAIAAAEARLPRPAPWQAEFSREGEELRLRVRDADFSRQPPAHVWFYPETWGDIDQSAPQSFRIEADGLALSLKPGDVAVEAGREHAIPGVLVLAYADGSAQGFAIQAAATQTETLAAGEVASDAAHGLFSALLMAFLGGLTLNLMPCVFPVLSIKALALLAHREARGNRQSGLAYLSGVLASFAALAGMLSLLRLGGEQLGWGFQFQSPAFVALMAVLMFVIGLNLSGVFAFGARVTGIGESLTRRAGLSGSFFTGVLAVIVATPCTAPFMGAAIAYALTQGIPALFAIFFSLGLGLALPYVLLSFWPPLQRLLPRPGAWMETLRQILAFPMYGTAIWLVWVLALQSGADGVLKALSGMLLLAFAAWLHQRGRAARVHARRLATGVALLALLAAALVLRPDHWPVADGQPRTAQGQENWEAYTPARLESLLEEGKPVFVNLTASWCVTCLVNERVALNRAEVRDALRAGGIVYLKGDWTNRDAEIARLLARHGRNGVPLYLYYPKGKFAPAQVLPQLLTPALVLEALSSPPSPASSQAFSVSPSGAAGG